MDLKALLLEAKQKVHPSCKSCTVGTSPCWRLEVTRWKYPSLVGAVRHTTEQVDAALVDWGSDGGAQDLGYGGWPCHRADPQCPGTPFPQGERGCAFCEAWVIGSPTAPSLKPCRRSRLATSAARTLPGPQLHGLLSWLPPLLREASVPGAPAATTAPQHTHT